MELSGGQLVGDTADGFGAASQGGEDGGGRVLLGEGGGQQFSMRSA